MSFYCWMRKNHSQTSLFKALDDDTLFPWDLSIDDMVIWVDDDNIYHQLSNLWDDYIDDIYEGGSVKMTRMELC